MRDQIQNVLLEHVAVYFQNDPALWQVYSEALIANAKQKNLDLKTAKMADIVGVLKAEIQAIRQSGHRGASIFNWVTNFVLWTCVLAKDPWVFVGKTDGKNGKRKYIWQEYTCAFAGKIHFRYIMCLTPLADQIERAWYRLGFRMKLIFHEPGSVATFTGYNFMVKLVFPTPGPNETSSPGTREMFLYYSLFEFI